MTLRIKLSIAMVALAAGATALVGFTTYASTGHELRERVDRSLEDAAARFAGPSDDDRDEPRRPGLDPYHAGDGDGDEYPRSFTQILVQTIDVSGGVVRAAEGGALPVGAADLSIAAGPAGMQSPCRDLDVDGEDFRVVTVSLAGGGAVQLARSPDETNDILDSILDRTLLIVVAMSLIALGIAVIVAQQVTRRLVRLTEVAVRVADSNDVEIHVPVDGRDETGRLGRAFSEMLASLSRARRSQHQLVQDAGDELRTPVTSLRTSSSVMRRFGELSPGPGGRLLDYLDGGGR